MSIKEIEKYLVPNKSSTPSFIYLSALNVNDKVESKNGFDYLSWAFAWGELKKIHPEASFKVYENNEGMPFFKGPEGYFAKVGVTVNNLEHISYLPAMDLRNKALKTADAMDINKTIQRALVKAIALHGLGLYLYTGEDLPTSLPEDDDESAMDRNKKADVKPSKQVSAPAMAIALAQAAVARKVFTKAQILEKLQAVSGESITDAVESLSSESLKAFVTFIEGKLK